MTTMRSMPSFSLPFSGRLAVGLVGAACLALASPAGAQSAGDLGSQVRPVAPTAKLAGPEAPPPSLPGSRAEATAVAPASRPALDMPPTEALFDAINRGDLAAAKDAINRGANVNGRNVLGLTPIDLAVDLGRNEITFVLLSLRGSDGANHAGPPVTAASASPAAAPRTVAMRRPARPAPVTQPVAPQAPQLFAGNGGTPDPQAGFLGFGPTR